MKVWYSVFNLIGVVMLLMISMCYLNVSQTFQRDFDQVRLNYAVEYATEAMFLATLETDDLDIDYSDLGNVSIDSSDALDIFCSLICYSYDMSTSEENFIDIENSIASVVLAGAGGYYIGQFMPEDQTVGDGARSDGLRLVWSIRYPYFINPTKNALGDGEHYQLMKDDKSYAVEYMNGKWTQVTIGDSIASTTTYVPNEYKYPMNVDELSIQQAVDNQIHDAMMREIARKNLNYDEFQFRFFLPDVTTLTGVNKIEPPAILMLMENIDFASSERIHAISVSGFKVTPRVNIVAFTDTVTGRNYYCYESQLLETEKDACCGGTGDFHIENYYRTLKDAACEKGLNGAGYYAPYHEIMARKITKEQ